MANEFGLLIGEFEALVKAAGNAAQFASSEIGALARVLGRSPKIVESNGHVVARNAVPSAQQIGGPSLLGTASLSFRATWDSPADIAKKVAVAVRAILAVLREQSPVKSGKYRDSHTLYINGDPVSDVPSSIPVTSDVMILNPVPYARKIELGTTESGRPFVLRVPAMLYARVAQELSPRYSEVLHMQALEQGRGSFSFYSSRKGPVRPPVLMIYPVLPAAGLRF